MSPTPRIRCAIYTRKSSEEGLEQSFNSLHAQREACEAYIHSQRHEGWQVVREPYDDGGFSGGSLERPALKKLLEDIARKSIDTVVVYKVDRLTRSLTDFAKIVEQFDKQGVSFVSVTQQFNTTTSMGRLTLNVLLSFAQFEREVTGERIRDKVHGGGGDSVIADSNLRRSGSNHVEDMVRAEAAEFDVAAARRNIERVRSGMQIFEVSAKIGTGMPEVFQLLRDRLAHARESRPTFAIEASH
jgi:DNA invertase Pin-like site-specific DNA recombinase